MDFTGTGTEEPVEPEAIIVRADEVDGSGADISTITPDAAASESNFNERIESRRAHDAQSQGSPKILANAVPSPPRPLTRPILRREGSTPAPPLQPPPPTPLKQEEIQAVSQPAGDEANGNLAQDSLSLFQLKKLVADLPKLEPKAYAYEYEEVRSFPEELQEWFSYAQEDLDQILSAREIFEQEWEAFVKSKDATTPCPWNNAEPKTRQAFVRDIIGGRLSAEHQDQRVEALKCGLYVALGAWSDTAGGKNAAAEEDFDFSPSTKRWLATQSDRPALQLRWIIEGVGLLFDAGVARKMYVGMTEAWRREQETETATQDDDSQDNAEIKIQPEDRCSNLIATLVYVFVEFSRWRQDESDGQRLWQELLIIKPSPLVLFGQMTAKLRWDEAGNPLGLVPKKILLLFWKSMLLAFGSFKDLEESKRSLRHEANEPEKQAGEEDITASPLDYHLFRQEIMSKYPAYNPPPPILPIEPENNTMLPPLPNHTSQHASQENLVSMAESSTSLFNKPVHIATPAPSPPPSPAGPGGKGGKKQNYQTNQNFPFLYPTSQESLLSLQVEGGAASSQSLRSRFDSDVVPASISEAGQLFASRTRMSRSIRQLWAIRELYVREGRGWTDEIAGPTQNGTESAVTGDESKEDSRTQRKSDDIAKYTKSTNPFVQTRLESIFSFYRELLPDLQSLIIVLWKELFQSVSYLVSNTSINETDGAEDGSGDWAKRKTNANSSASIDALANDAAPNLEKQSPRDVDKLDEARSIEISSKALSAILLLMLKWFKVSHILEYEYLSQLMLDANFIPLILKYFAHQDIDKAVQLINDHEDLNLFAFCRQHSKHAQKSAGAEPDQATSDSSEDEAVPPPIRQQPRASPPDKASSPQKTPPVATSRPEVDELGYPISGDLPQTPLTKFSARFFITNVNLLRVLQKMTKRKAHRALMLVQYKSSTILRKALKIPQSDLRLYTLKLFKSQVPFCGRKWRQTNMRVITAIYLHCRPRLRDEWLCGGDIDAIVEEAVPVEQAGRALVHWWHMREFRDVIEFKNQRREVPDGDTAAEDSALPTVDDAGEHDYFARELEKMGWGVDNALLRAEADEAADEALEAAVNGAGLETGVPPTPEYEMAPVRMEGWA